MKIIKFKEWSGEDYQDNKFKEHTPNMIILHHSEIPNSKYKGKDTVKSIRKFHINNREFLDIAYNYLIDSDGIVYEGRKEKHVGSHCFPNTGKLGVCLIMNGDLEELSKTMKDTLIDLLENLCREYSIDPMEDIKPHSKFSSKTCPGVLVKKKLHSICKAVKGRIK